MYVHVKLVLTFIFNSFLLAFGHYYFKNGFIIFFSATVFFLANKHSHIHNNIDMTIPKNYYYYSKIFWS